ncbi:hypothetical protein FSARC_8537 [Fusarium sarcochroum]|uniref:Uncharacterized protein n=1 Tax=Fusarium sarcochroum TaxID=1208366 RepID=A0A8H4X6V4_9HYPO|nr:hypothetical protein FSARC_8537 [Fusarium sarcochroum]
MTTTHNGPRPLPIIHLNAFPGTGKLAIAKELFLINRAATYASAYIFTDFQSSNDLGSATCEEYAACAKARGCDYIPITLHRDEELGLERLNISDRTPHGKLSNTEQERGSRHNGELYKIDEYDASLSLDITNLSVKEAATKIFEHLVRVSPVLRASQNVDVSDWMIF